MISKKELRKHAEDLAADELALIKEVLVKGNIAVIEAAHEAKQEAVRKLQADVSEWARQAGVMGANHLDKIGDEFAELKDAPADPMEMADVLLALMLHAEQNCVNLIEAGSIKLESVKRRSYGLPDARGVVRHIAEACTYPECTCPFDAPADKPWCARGLPPNGESNRTPCGVAGGKLKAGVRRSG